jgi:hypothetical protein
MADVKMTVYSPIYELTGVTMWASEEEYRRAVEFLTSIGASRVPPADAVDKKADFYLANRAQIDAFGDYQYAVITTRPKIGPPRLDMDYYCGPAGGGGHVTWANEDEYQQARKFLLDIGAAPVGVLDPRYENPEVFDLETREQLRAFHKFAKSVEEETGVAPVFSSSRGPRAR